METLIKIDGRMNGKKRENIFECFDFDCDYDWMNDAVGNQMKCDV